MEEKAETVAEIQEIAAADSRPKRERKQTEQLYVADTKEVKVVDIQSGNGVVLSEYAYFCKGLEKLKGDDEVIKSLHNLCYGVQGKKLDTKKNLRKFSGFSTETNKDEKVKKVVENKKKWTVGALKVCMELFGLEKSGTREELIARLIDFLNKPSILKTDAGTGGSVRGGGAGKKAKGTKRKSTGKGAKDTKKAKRPLSAYILFCNAHRQEVKEDNPEAAFTEMASLLAAKWKASSDAEKAIWQHKSKELAGAAVEDADADADKGGEDDEEETGDEAAEEGQDDDAEDLFDADDDGYEKPAEEESAEAKAEA